MKCSTKDCQICPTERSWPLVVPQERLQPSPPAAAAATPVGSTAMEGTRQGSRLRQRAQQAEGKARQRTVHIESKQEMRGEETDATQHKRGAANRCANDSNPARGTYRCHTASSTKLYTVSADPSGNVRIFASKA